MSLLKLEFDNYAQRKHPGYLSCDKRALFCKDQKETQQETSGKLFTVCDVIVRLTFVLLIVR